MKQESIWTVSGDHSVLNRRAFTLIELLAVIVILSIIALIAVPIIINIIDNTKRSAFKESISIVSKAGQLYYTEVLLKNNEGIEEKIFEFPDSVEGLKIDKNKTLKGIMKVRKDGNTTFALSDGVYCAKKGYNDKNIDYNKDIENCIIPVEIAELEVEENIVIKEEETITITPTIFPSVATNKKLKWTSLDANIATVENGIITGVSPGNTTITVETMDGSNISKTINVTVKELLIKAVTESTKSLAGNIPQGKFAKGDEYIINVDGIHKYHFYVLGVEGNNVNLILNGNICSDGTLATSENKCYGAWTGVGNNSYGPDLAMLTIYEATKNWINIPNIYIRYTDEGSDEYGYGGITTSGNTTQLINKEGTVVASYENLKARLPRLSEVEAAGCKYGGTGSCLSWLVNRLSSSSTYPAGTKEDISVNGYWILSSYPNIRNKAKYINSLGQIESQLSHAEHYGVRPVITMSKTNLS